MDKPAPAQNIDQKKHIGSAKPPTNSADEAKLIHYIPERVEHRERWVGALQKAGVPLKVIVGSVDPIPGSHMASRYRELVPHADVSELAGVGHYPQVHVARQSG